MRRRRGVVLILVLWILVFVVALTLSVAFEARVEVAASGAELDEVRLRALADSAVDRALAELRLDATPGDNLAETWRDAENDFKAVEVGEDGRYWLLLAEPDPGDGRVVRYGLRDESSRLNVNVATEQQLLALPGITDEAVAGILDWRDEDDEVRENGAETGYYATLDPPYLAKNGSIERLEELLKIRGVTPEIYYGEDRNRNGVLDPGEDDGDTSYPPDDADGEIDYGLIDYLTVFSQVPNLTADGGERLVMSGADPEEVLSRLRDAGISGQGEQAVSFQLLGPGGGGGPGGRGGGGGGGGAQSVAQLLLDESISAEDAAVILDQLADSDAEMLTGQVNVNTAPEAVLAGLPGLELEDVGAIVQRRLDPSEDLSSPAWLLQVLEREVFVGLAPLVTTRSEQFTVHAVVQLGQTPRYRRVEVLVDRTYAPVRVLLWRDVTAWGFPFAGERGEELP